jgi:hypothetical protein
MMGAEDPELKKASMVNNMLKETDMNDLNSVRKLVNQLNSVGASREAMSLIPRIDKLSEAESQREAKRDETQTRLEARKEEIRIQAENRMEQLRVQTEAALERAREQSASRELIAAMMADARKQAAQIAAEARTQTVQLTTALKADKPLTPAQLKAEEKKLAREEATQGLDDTLSNMEKLVDSLNAGGGITSTTKSPLENTLSSMGSSGIGQMVGRATGTENQKNRDVLAAQKMQLLNDIKNATGMSAQQMNSNVELQLWMDSLGAPGMTAEANKEILKSIRKKYVNRKTGSSNPPASSGGSRTKSGTAYSIVED